MDLRLTKLLLLLLFLAKIEPRLGLSNPNLSFLLLQAKNLRLIETHLGLRRQRLLYPLHLWLCELLLPIHLGLLL